MAAGGGGHRRHSRGEKRLLFVEERWMLDGSCDAYLVFKINLKDMFASAAVAEGGEEDWAMPMRSFPHPVAGPAGAPGPRRRPGIWRRHQHRRRQQRQVHRHLRRRRRRRGDVRAGASLLHDQRYHAHPVGNPAVRRRHQPSAADQRGFAPQLPGPPAPAAVEQRQRQPWPLVLARAAGASSRPVQDGVGPRESVLLRGGLHGRRHARLGLGAGQGHLLLRHGLPRMAQGRRLGAAIRGPRPLRLGPGPLLRHLPAPPLPLRLRRPTSGVGEPPAVRYVWQDESYPREVGDRGFHVQSPGTLAYLGEGKFCIAWPIAVEFASKDMMIVPSRFALFLMAVQVVRRSCRREPTAGSGELRLLKRRVRCYKMSSSGVDGYVLQASAFLGLKLNFS
ncbi:hypothetical protein PVAP13_6NG321840 [Panicum virgatum]|uniref:Uncharacterized protein n=1 Tax=Panicum virgatum TaxID=38727 RepID=A0A8T0R3J0_PANVG|nr:hypothetical protein PVAP13_6NG321840 [Panicum virgatum]